MFVGDVVTCIFLGNREKRFIQSFESSKLKFCINLSKLDMSGCWHINPEIVMAAVKHCSHLKEILLENCTQFTEQQMRDMLSSLEKLEFINCTGTQEMIYCNALQIISSLYELEAINVEPKYIIFERNDWKRLVEKFHLIRFGHSIMRMFPHYGRYLKRNEKN